MAMLAHQRHREILGRLRDAGGVRVADLAKTLHVTEETIRRDLEKLSLDGKLVRTHGGAAPVRDDRRDLPFDVRKTTHLSEKQTIAAHAVRYVAEGDVIALDPSSTAHELAKILPDCPLTVVTNSLPVAVTLLDRTHVRVVCTGGTLDMRSRSFTGLLAEQALERFNITKLFLSAKGVDLSRGLSEVTEEQARLKRRMMDVAGKTFLLVDHSKLGVKSVVFFASVTEADVLITDAGGNAEVLGELAVQLRPDPADFFGGPNLDAALFGERGKTGGGRAQQEAPPGEGCPHHFGYAGSALTSSICAVCRRVCAAMNRIIW